MHGHMDTVMAEVRPGTHKCTSGKWRCGAAPVPTHQTHTEAAQGLEASGLEGGPVHNAMDLCVGSYGWGISREALWNTQ